MPRWTIEARQKQAHIQQTRRSWEKSTGPKTASGKARSRLNSYKHGMRSALMTELRHLLRAQDRLLRDLRAQHRLVALASSPSLRAQRSNPSCDVAKSTAGWIATSASPPRNDSMDNGNTEIKTSKPQHFRIVFPIC